MKLIILIVAALVAIVASAPVEEYPKVVEYVFEQKPDGSYVLRYQFDDGTFREEQGELREAFDEENKPHNVIFVHGKYRYVNPDGNTEEIIYRADNNGYQAEGDSIPKVPVE